VPGAVGCLACLARPRHVRHSLASMAIETTGGVIHWLLTLDGLRLRAAHWAGGARGTVLLLNGRTEFIEKYLEPVAELQARGFAAWTLDWRGQGLSSRLLRDPVPGHAVRFGDLLDDVELLLDRLVLPGLGGGPLVVLGHSMGGHLAAHLLARRPRLFARGILCAPMMGFLPRHGLGGQVIRAVAVAACLVPGVAGRPGPGTSRLPPLDRPFKGNPLTGCPDRYASDAAWMREQAALQVGGASWGWLQAASASMAALMRPAVVRRITAPVLVLVAGDDRLVDNRATRRFAARLPQGTLVEFPGARHELLREHDGHRLAAWAAIDEFLTQGDNATPHFVIGRT